MVLYKVSETVDWEEAARLEEEDDSEEQQLLPKSKKEIQFKLS